MKWAKYYILRTVDEIAQCEDDNMDEQKVSNPWLWHLLDKDVNIDIKSVCLKLKWVGESIAKIYLKEY